MIKALPCLRPQTIWHLERPACSLNQNAGEYGARHVFCACLLVLPLFFLQMSYFRRTDALRVEAWKWHKYTVDKIMAGMLCTNDENATHG